MLSSRPGTLLRLLINIQIEQSNARHCLCVVEYLHIRFRSNAGAAAGLLCWGTAYRASEGNKGEAGCGNGVVLPRYVNKQI